MNANLLLDDVFGIRRSEGGREFLSLPALLEALGRNEVESFTGTQRHQVDAFHIFLCYLAGAVLDREDEPNPVQGKAFWLRGLRQLAGRDDDDAWTLIVDDPTRPAFMQPPVPSVDLFASYKPKAITPDELDVLQTAKNHDLKGARLSGATVEAWAIALISMQTMSGFLGQGNYGISRMNGGFGSRPCVATYTDLQSSRRWGEDVARLMSRRDELTRPPWAFRRDGAVLLWTIPWDGANGLGLNALHPFFVEVCRMVRIASQTGGFTALGRPSKAARVTVGKDTGGNIGDPWTPLRRKDGAAMGASARGFHPKLLRDLVISHEDHEPSAMQSFPAPDRAAWFHASVLVRGQGTTDGYHEARVYLPPRVITLLLTGGDQRDRLGSLSEWALTRARDVRTKALRPALFSLTEGGPSRWPNTGRREAGQWVDSWLGRYDEQWEADYFPWLWKTVDQADEDARAAWLHAMRALATGVLDRALAATPQRTGRRYRGKVRSTGLFHGAFRRHFEEEMNHAAG